METIQRRGLNKQKTAVIELDDFSTEGESRMPAGDVGISGKAVYTRVHCTIMYDYGLIRSITKKKNS